MDEGRCMKEKPWRPGDVIVGSKENSVSSREYVEFDFKVIPWNEMRYASAGDYYEVEYTKRRRKWEFRVADLGNTKYELLVFFHEFIEFFLTQEHGISEEEITKFDIQHISADEPGELPDAPYHNEHTIANAFERMLAALLNVDWEEYVRSQ